MRKIIIVLIAFLSVWCFKFFNTPNEVVNIEMIEDKLSHGTDMFQSQAKILDDEFSSIGKYDDVYEQKQASLLCGFDSINNLNEVFLGDISEDELLDKQIIALEGLGQKCRNWYQYFDSLSEAEKVEVKKAVQSFIKPNRWYEPNITPEKRIQLVRDALLDDPDGMEFSALYFLLQNDKELLQELGRRVGSNYWEWIKSSSLHIATLYNCSKFDNCTSSSLTMLSLCLSDEQYCGYNYEQYLAKIYSQGQNTDIQNIVVHLREIMLQGYPDIVFKE